MGMSSWNENESVFNSIKNIHTQAYGETGLDMSVACQTSGGQNLLLSWTQSTSIDIAGDPEEDDGMNLTPTKMIDHRKLYEETKKGR